MPKFGTKSALFWYFWAKKKKTIKKLLPYLKSAPSEYWNCKIFEETKMPKFGIKNALFGYFWPKMPYFGIFGQNF